MQTQGVGEYRLDDVTVTHDGVDRIRAEGPVPVTDAGHRPMLHRRQGFTLREHGGGGMGLDHLP